MNNKFIIKTNPLGYPTDEAFKIVNQIDWKRTNLSADEVEALEAMIKFTIGMY